MKKRVLAIILLLVVTMFVMGCSKVKENVDKAIVPSNDNSNISTEEETIAVNSVSESNEKSLKKIAKEENLSVHELELVIDELAQLTADKYGITKEEYITSTEKTGKTVYDEMKLAADTLGISIVEYRNYEKNNVSNMSTEQKETMNDMSNALKEAESIVIPEAGPVDVEEMLGIHGNKTEEFRIVNEFNKDMISYKVKNILKDSEDEYGIEFEYVSNADSEKLVEYYDDLVMNTEEYLKIEQPGIPGAIIQGTIDGKSIYIGIEETPDGMLVNACFDLSGKS